MPAINYEVSELKNLKVDGLSVVHSNLNGVKSHLDDLFDVLSLCQSSFSVVGLSETRLRSEEELFF